MGDDVAGLGDSLWVSPDGCTNTLVTVEEPGLEEVPVSLAETVLQQDVQEAGTWEESCLLMFSKFLGFFVARHEEEIFNLMSSICERRFKLKGKGVQRLTKFNREFKKLEWAVQEKHKNNRGGSSQRGKGIHIGW